MENKKVLKLTDFQKNEENPFMKQAIEGIENHVVKKYKSSTVDGSGQRNGFKISNAIHADGTEANLQYIDFIKVQCGVLAKSGWLGEVSTEVFSFEDLTK